MILLLMLLTMVYSIDICPGDTRGDRKCNHDSTHRVCANMVFRIHHFGDLQVKIRGATPVVIMVGIMVIYFVVLKRLLLGVFVSGRSQNG